MLRVQRSLCMQEFIEKHRPAVMAQQINRRDDRLPACLDIENAKRGEQVLDDGERSEQEG